MLRLRGNPHGVRMLKIVDKIEGAMLRFICFWVGHDDEPHDVYAVPGHTVVFTKRCDACGRIKEYER